MRAVPHSNSRIGIHLTKVGDEYKLVHLYNGTQTASTTFRLDAPRNAMVSAHLLVWRC